MRVKLDKSGRIVLPKRLRDGLRLNPGDVLEIELFDDRILLRPLLKPKGMRKKRGVWVFAVGKPLRAAVVRKAFRQVRRKRHSSILGEGSIR